MSEPSSVKIRCLIVDDSAAFLASAARLLESEGFTVVGTAASSREAVRLAEKLKPEVALLDVEIGSESGFDLARKLADLEPPLPSVLISMYPEDDLVEAIAASPAVGFMAKSKLSAAAIRELLRPP